MSSWDRGLGQCLGYTFIPQQHCDGVSVLAARWGASLGWRPASVGCHFLVEQWLTCMHYLARCQHRAQPRGLGNLNPEFTSLLFLSPGSTQVGLSGFVPHSLTWFFPGAPVCLWSEDGGRTTFRKLAVVLGSACRVILVRDPCFDGMSSKSFPRRGRGLQTSSGACRRTYWTVWAVSSPRFPSS